MSASDFAPLREPESDGYDMLRLRVSDETLPWKAEHRSQLDRLLREHAHAIQTLERAGWTLADGAEAWKPPVNENVGEMWRRLLAVESERDAWQAFAEHQEWCRACGEDGVSQCYEGNELRTAAKALSTPPTEPNG